MLSKKDGVKERDRLVNEIEELQRRLQMQTRHVEELEEKQAEDDEKIKDLHRQLEDISNDAFKGKRSLEQISNKLQETTEEKQFLTEELRKYKQQVRANDDFFSEVFSSFLSLEFLQAEAEHRVVVQQNLQMLSLRANLDKHTTQNNLNNMKLTRLNGKIEFHRSQLYEI